MYLGLLNYSNQMLKTCKKHGVTEFTTRSDGYTRCKKCVVEAVDKRRKKLKEMAVAHKGGKCEHCGYNKYIGALEFHHNDPNEKDFGISGTKQTASWNKIKKEVDKCTLLCSNCHKEEHARLNALKAHVEVATGS